MKKVESTQTHVGNVNRDMETLRKKIKESKGIYRNKKYSNKNEGYLSYAHI